MHLNGWTRGVLLLPLIATLAAGAAACGSVGSGHGAANHGAAAHGEVVAYLRIPYQVTPGADTGAVRVVHVRVRPGERFAVKVATSDGPFLWGQAGPKPDRRVVRTIGNVNDGHCPAHEVGCRVPYFHVLQARAAGTTSMTWLYRQLTCSSLRKRMAQPTRSCVATVTFQITVR